MWTAKLAPVYTRDLFYITFKYIYFSLKHTISIPLIRHNAETNFNFEWIFELFIT